MWADLPALAVAVVAGAIAAVTGFGIGSLLTPVLALQVDTRLAVAAVSIPSRSRIERWDAVWLLPLTPLIHRDPNILGGTPVFQAPVLRSGI